jgi:membrane carboxypeptidase/penicillin-binding protein
MKKTLLVIAVLMVLILGYYGFEIVKAHLDTPGIKAKFLDKSSLTLSADELSPWQKEIIIKVQDPNFYNHKGVEFSTPGSGWTTITQSLAKWFYFHPFKPGIRKIKQTLLARFVLHYHLSKEEQFLVFINHVWFDKNVRGFKKAAMHFYQKGLAELSEDEFISLMAMPVAPRNFNVRTNPQNNQRRSQRIRRMLSGEYVPKGLFDIYYDKS